MSITDLLPWKRPRRTEIERREALDPIDMLRHDMNRWFDDFFTREFSSDFGLAPSYGTSLSEFVPTVDVVESDTEITLTAELPGMSEEDFDLQIQDNALVISGHKEQHAEKKDGNVYRAERSYGAFQRHIPLPSEINADKTSALYKNGVLTVTLPKSKPSPRKKITIKRT